MDEDDCDYDLVELNESHFEEALELIASTYEKTQPICIAMKTSKATLKKLFHSRILEGCRSGFSYAFFHKGTMISVSTCTTLSRYLQIDIPVIEELRARVALDKKLHEGFMPKEDIDRFAYGMQSATHPNYGSQHLYTRLGASSAFKLHEKGYDKLLTTLYHGASQKAWKDLSGNKIINRVNLRQFQFQGKRPFKLIKDCEQVTLQMTNIDQFFGKPSL